MSFMLYFKLFSQEKMGTLIEDHDAFVKKMHVDHERALKEAKYVDSSPSHYTACVRYTHFSPAFSAEKDGLYLELQKLKMEISELQVELREEQQRRKRKEESSRVELERLRRCVFF
jgi:hypothetical protein